MNKKKFVNLYLFPILFTFLGLGTMIYMLLANSDYRWLSALCLVAIGWLPPLLRLFKVRFPFSLQLIVFSFTFLALFLGVCLYFYTTIFWFDILCHSLFGYVGAMIGIYFLYYGKSKANHFLLLIIIILISMGFGALWEIFEYILSKITGNDVQHVIDTGINDTMEDLICNLGGAIVFTLHYIIDLFCFKEKCFTAIKKDFSQKTNW